LRRRLHNDRKDVLLLIQCSPALSVRQPEYPQDVRGDTSYTSAVQTHYPLAIEIIEPPFEA
jgi:hypothetical protein